MKQFFLPAGFETQQLVDLLETAVLTASPTTERLTIYDTFDWRLYNLSLAFFKAGSHYILRDLEAQHPLVQTELTEIPQFVWDLPHGILRTKLAQILSMRALIPMADMDRQETTYSILNSDEKTICRIVLEEIYPRKREEKPPFLSLVTIQPVRGYIKAETRLINSFLENKFEPCNGEIIPRTLIAVGQEPGGYSAKLTIDLKPNMRADTATNIILRYMLQIMKMNESHVKQDVDTEFLHDFRVAVRRTRSALSQVKSVFPEEQTERFKQDFKFIGQLSNQLRDLDVYLLSEEDYKKQLPEFLQADIHPLFEYLQSKRAEALQSVIIGLESTEYQHIIQDWELFLEEPPKDDKTAVNAAMPILKLAKKRIYKHYQRIIEEGNIILVDAQDELLHELRIECKKLRYLMEFFASLFPPEEISRLVRQLKELQTNLGDFNDFCVQEEYLLHVAREMSKSDTFNNKENSTDTPVGDTPIGDAPIADAPVANGSLTDALIAIGCLVGNLHQRREIVKSEFSGAFNHFASPENEALFIQLFAPEKKQKSNKKRGKA